MNKVYDRKEKKVIEIKHFGGNTLSRVYKSKILTRLVTGKIVSKIYGLYNSTVFSKSKLNKFIAENNIDMTLYEEKEYKSFNDFFIRKPKNINFDSTNFISPCDGKLLVYEVSENKKINVKGIEYLISELIDENDIELNNSYAFVYRLTLDDCHHFYYIDDGDRIKRVKHKGRLHTVSNSSKDYKVYKENEREYSILNTKNFGNLIYMEVGALLVGKIINNDCDSFKRGEEKGYFLPGGSTIIIIANNIKVDEDILEYSNKDIETIVHIGEKVGVKQC